MFTPEAIQARLREKPFRPLRIITGEGQRFDIYHPDLVLVGWRDLTIGFASPDSPTIYDRQTRVDRRYYAAANARATEAFRGMRPGGYEPPSSARSASVIANRTCGDSSMRC